MGLVQQYQSTIVDLEETSIEQGAFEKDATFYSAAFSNLADSHLAHSDSGFAVFQKRGVCMQPSHGRVGNHTFKHSGDADATEQMGAVGMTQRSSINLNMIDTEIIGFQSTRLVLFPAQALSLVHSTQLLSLH